MEAGQNIKDLNNKEQFLRGIKDCIPTIFGYISIGIACGVLSRSCDLTLGEAVGMSTLIYGGSSQIIAAGMIATKASVLSIIITIFFVNLRHMFMSASMAPYFKENSLLKNISLGSLLTDETFLVAANEGIRNKNINFWWMTGLNIAAYINWAIATCIGVLIGNLIPDYKALGLDFALTAMFIGLLISSAENTKLKKACIIIFVSVISLLITTKFMSTNTGIIIASVIGAGAGVLIK